MKKYPIEYLPSAEQDLSDIIAYIMLDNPQAADRLLKKFDETISLLSYFPLIGTLPKDPPASKSAL